MNKIDCITHKPQQKSAVSDEKNLCVLIAQQVSLFKK